MLRQLLRLVAGAGTKSTSELATQLNVTEALTQHMLEELRRQGYLQSVVPGCSVPCEACSLHPGCPHQTQPLIWTLTRKGEALLAKEDYSG